MKKSKTTEQLKGEYEKVYESPLNWCPLYGYLPEIKKADFVNNPDNYSIALRCSELIQDTRYYFFDVTIDCMQEYISLPDIENFPYPHNNYVDKCIMMRHLFQSLDYLTLKMLFEVRGCHDIFSNKQSISDKPVGRTSNRWANSLSVFAGSVKLNDSLVTTDYLLSEAQKITGKALDYNYDAKQLYALYIILESWLILTSLFFNPNKTNSKDTLDAIHERESYIKDLNNIADRYYMRCEHEPDLKEKEEIKKKAAPYFKLQSDRAKIKNDKTKKKNELRNEYLQCKTRGYLHKHGVTSAQELYDYFVKKDVKLKMEEINIQLDINLRQFRTIIKPVLDEYKEKNRT